MALQSLKRRLKKKSAGVDVWFGRAPEDLPEKKLGDFRSDVFASYSGPDTGLALAHQLEVAKLNDEKGAADEIGVVKTSLIAGASRWNMKNRKAYGICMSLYDQHPVNGKISGDPIADSFGLCARENSAVLVVADGVNWGEKPKLAARCAVYGCMRYINQKLFESISTRISTTHEAFKLLLLSLDEAHDMILRHDGGLTTLCVALVCPIKDSKQFAVCIVNVGDSLAFVFSKRHGVREITTGSHDIRSERDIRDAGGALGPVNGTNPELHNLTCSMTCVDAGDIVFLTTDGISDNFDPVVTKIAIAKQKRTLREETTMKKPAPEDLVPEKDASNGDESNTLESNSPLEEFGNNGELSEECESDYDSVLPGESQDGKPVMAPHERHRYAVKEMERVIHEFELFTECACSAQEMCGALLQHVLKLTDPKRKVLENPRLYGRRMKVKDREKRDSEIVAKLSKSAGKLDHATIIGYEIGFYHGNEDEDYDNDEENEDKDEAEDTEESGTTTTDDIHIDGLNFSTEHYSESVQ